MIVSVRRFASWAVNMQARATVLGALMRRAPADRRDIARACVALAATRLALGTLPYPRAVARLDAWSRPAARPGAAGSGLAAERIAESVVQASALLPGRSSCLAQALGAKLLLGRAGLAVEVRGGVSRQPGVGIEAHAWVEHDGKPILGAPDPKYSRLPRPIA
jgi:hypothetical protein